MTTGATQKDAIRYHKVTPSPDFFDLALRLLHAWHPEYLSPDRSQEQGMTAHMFMRAAQASDIPQLSSLANAIGGSAFCFALWIENTTITIIHIAEQFAQDFLKTKEARSYYEAGDSPQAIVHAIEGLLESEGEDGENFQEAAALGLGLLNKTTAWLDRKGSMEKDKTDET